MILLCALTFAALAAALFATAAARARACELTARLADRDGELARVRDEQGCRREETEKLRGRLEQALRESAGLGAQLQSMEGKFAELSQKSLREGTQQLATFAEQFLKRAQESSKAELALREQAVAEMVKPVHESLQRVGEKIHGLEKEASANSSKLTEQIRMVSESSDKLRTEAGRLVTALRAPSQRGRWGEQQLRNTIELAGLRDHVDFLEQPVVHMPDGTLRPDIAVRLPGNKTVLIDSKVPFEAFAAAVEADERDRPALLRRHAEQLRTHICQLARKQYWEAFSGSPELIVLFLPGEGFLGAALDADPMLHEEAFKNRVVLATPSTLLALLLTVAHVWKQESVALNAREIANEGRELHKRIGGLAAHFAKLGRALESTVGAYNDAIGSFERRLIPAARKFEDLKAAGSDVTIELLEEVDARPRLPAPVDGLPSEEAN